MTLYKHCFFFKINIQLQADSPVKVIFCSSCLFTKQIVTTESFAKYCSGETTARYKRVPL